MWCARLATGFMENPMKVWVKAGVSVSLKCQMKASGEMETGWKVHRNSVPSSKLFSNSKIFQNKKKREFYEQVYNDELDSDTNGQIP